jgi:hypothetical protein
MGTQNDTAPTWTVISDVREIDDDLLDELLDVLADVLLELDAEGD